MKKRLYLLPALLLAMTVGCTPTEKKADLPPPPQAGQENAAAPAAPAAQPQAQPESAQEIVQGYAGGLKSSIDKAKTAQARNDKGAILTAVREFQSEQGRFPSSLDEIKGRLRANTDLTLYDYDPNTGDVTLKP